MTQLQSMRLGVDVGGTFTDVVLELPTGQGSLSHESAKVLTTPASPEKGVVDGIKAVLGKADVKPQQLSGIIHGTTLATNALIERRGAHTAFVTTEGFRDVVETRTESRFEQYDINLVLPTPLVERRHRYGLRERIDAHGRVLVPFDEDAAQSLAATLKDGGYESVAVGFLHSYVNPAHEERFRDVLTKAMPEVAVSLSSEVSPQMRELERFNTVCANAYVQPVMSSYLHRLSDDLKALGADCPVYVIHSGGGLMSLSSAARLPVRLVESGPAGGAIFAADLAQRYGLDRVLSYDMGGTTAKICLISDFTPSTAKSFEVARTTRFAKGSGTSISIPVIEMIEIGAGGGSIASVDVLDQIRVGPRSAGADPGPACYGLGGQNATVTDADLVLGRLSADTFGADEITLDSDAAVTALASGVGEQLGLDETTAAIGVSEVVDESMANAARVHATESGYSLDGFTMIAFGGAAPVHAVRLCAKLGVEQLLIPPGAGVGSAIGFLRAPFSYEAVRSHYCRLDDFDPAAVETVLTELTEEASSFVTEAAATASAFVVEDLHLQRWVYMRYVGQGWEIPVELPTSSVARSIVARSIMDGTDAELLSTEFTKAYEAFFGRAIQGLEIEAVSWSVRAVLADKDVERLQIHDAEQDFEATAVRGVWDVATGSEVNASVVPREQITAGMRVAGPAVIVESQTTTVVPSTHDAIGQGDGCLLLQPKAGV